MSTFKIIELPKITDPRGNLSFIEYGKILPFEIERVFWTYDVPGGDVRGGHAYKNQYELIVALSGSFDVVLRDSMGNQSTISMNRSYYGLYIPPLIWRHMENFSTNAVSLHLANLPYNEEEYIREYNTLLKYTLDPLTIRDEKY